MRRGGSGCFGYCITADQRREMEAQAAEQLRLEFLQAAKQVRQASESSMGMIRVQRHRTKDLKRAFEKKKPRGPVKRRWNVNNVNDRLNALPLVPPNNPDYNPNNPGPLGSIAEWDDDEQERAGDSDDEDFHSCEGFDDGSEIVKTALGSGTVPRLSVLQSIKDGCYLDIFDM